MVDPGPAKIKNHYRWRVIFIIKVDKINLNKKILFFLKKKEGFFKNVWYIINKVIKWNIIPQCGTIKKE